MFVSVRYFRGKNMFAFNILRKIQANTNSGVQKQHQRRPLDPLLNRSSKRFCPWKNSNALQCHFSTKTIRVCSKKLSSYCIKVNCIWPDTDKVNSRRFFVFYSESFWMSKMMQQTNIKIEWTAASHIWINISMQPYKKIGHSRFKMNRVHLLKSKQFQYGEYEILVQNLFVPGQGI